MNDTYIIIVAAGRGSRYGAELPKQFCTLLGRPLLCHTIDAFLHFVGRENILLVLDNDGAEIWSRLCADLGYISPRHVIGGATRSESVRNAIAALSDAPSDTTIMIHDGARPLIDADTISRVCHVPEGYDGVIPAVAVTDSLRQLTTDGSMQVDRSQFVAVQTPQCFHLGTLRKVYIDNTSTIATDDATLVEMSGGRIAIIQGSPHNIKITNPGDIAIAEALLALENERL